jgi:maltose O-acetyltransferase
VKVGARWHRKLLSNHAYLYALNAYYALLACVPEPLRGIGYRLVLRRMGAGVYFDSRVYIKFPWLVEIGSRVSINRGVEMYPGYKTGSRIVIGDDVRIGPHARFHAASHDIDSADFSEIGADIVIGPHSWIGAGAMILSGVHVGAGAVVAAGSVVTRNVPDYAVIAGVPAKIIKYRVAAAMQLP